METSYFKDAKNVVIDGNGERFSSIYWNWYINYAKRRSFVRKRGGSFFLSFCFVFDYFSSYSVFCGIKLFWFLAPMTGTLHFCWHRLFGLRGIDVVPIFMLVLWYLLTASLSLILTLCIPLQLVIRLLTNVGQIMNKRN